jgi:hypothetical protein
VVTTVAGTVSTPALTPPVYPANWTTTGTVTGPSVSSRATTYGDGYVSTAQDGTSSLPFLQTTLAALSTPITDPNANVTSTTATYDLRWGVPDKNGPTYVSYFTSGSWTTSSNFQLMGHTISGQCQLGPIFGFCLNGATVAQPATDVLDAWAQGWTGRGVNILLVDGYSATNGSYLWGGDSHGITTMVLANRYALGATMYGLDYSLNVGQTLQTGLIKAFSGASATGASFQVVNTSFGANYWAIVGRQGPNVTDADVTTVFNLTQTAASTWAKLFDGRIAYPGYSFADAVITKAAGNDSITADKESYVKTYATNSSIQSRLLIVGAVNFVGSTGVKATIANYSNTAGVDSSVASRFLVASGTDPFSNGMMAIDGQPYTETTTSGTSYAAPRVAGYVAILRQKFPNLDAIKSSSVMLDTARYDTLTCYPNCDPAIYGKGEANLARALAPVGYLR